MLKSLVAILITVLPMSGFADGTIWRKKINFGRQWIYGMNAAEKIVIKNIYNHPVYFEGFFMDGKAFAMHNYKCKKVLEQQDETCELWVSFDPKKAVKYTGTFTILFTNNDMIQYTLKGEGTR